MSTAVNMIVSKMTTWLPNLDLTQKAVRLLMRYAADGPVQTRHGFKILFRRGQPVAMGLRRAIIAGSYEPEYFKALRRFATDTVLDIGAHEGFVALYLSSYAKHVIACEPNPENVELIYENVKLNPDRPISVERCVIGGGEGEGEFYCNPDQGAHGSLIKVDHLHYQHVLRVPMRTVDSITVDRGVGRVSLIKIDTEGYELEVLRGAEQLIARDHPVVCFEVSLTLWSLVERSVKELLEFLPSRGYKLYQVDEGGELIEFQWLNRRVDNLFGIVSQ